MNQQSESEVISPQHKIGWIGVGRMGFSMARRLLDAGCDFAVYNRTRSKAEPLADSGATIVDSPADLADRDIVFTMVSGPEDLLEVICGQNGLLSASGTPQMVVDCSSVSEEGSLKVRNALDERGAAMLSAPVSGNAKVVQAGMLTMVVSGPEPISFAIAVIRSATEVDTMEWVSGFMTRETVEGCTLARAATSLMFTFRMTIFWADLIK